MTTYRTTEHRTDRILKDWINKEELAFDLNPSLSVSKLQAILPPQCKKQLGELKPTDNVFRKMSSGFNKVSDVWIELMRFIWVQDFSPEQAIFGTVSTFLDSENVRVKLNASYDTPHQRNSIEVLCLNKPKYQGLIRYEGDRLSFPPSIFEAVIDRRLNVYSLYCENLSDLLLIPGVSDPHSLLMAENNARLAEENRELDEQSELAELDGVSDEDVWIESSDAELEAAQIEEATRDVHLEEMADVRDHNQLIGSLLDEETSDDAIALTPYDGDDGDAAAAAEIESVDDTDEDAEIKTVVDGHGYESDEVDGEIEDFDGNSILN